MKLVNFCLYKDYTITPLLRIIQLPGLRLAVAWRKHKIATANSAVMWYGILASKHYLLSPAVWKK